MSNRALSRPPKLYVIFVPLCKDPTFPVAWSPIKSVQLLEIVFLFDSYSFLFFLIKCTISTSFISFDGGKIAVFSN